MGISKPFFRIWRPGSGGYDEDERYADGRSRLCRAYEVIVQDLIRVFEYIDPVDDNLATYSHRLYEILLRATTEVEANLKRILRDNNYRVPPSKMSVADYRRVERACRLSDYEIRLDLWSPPRILKPFLEWREPNASLGWYRAYNSVKHDRLGEFSKASLQNAITAVSGLLAVLYSSFTTSSFMAIEPDFDSETDGFIRVPPSVFSVKPPNWPEAERYSFDWATLKDTAEPFQRFTF